ncbi:hypothetical protein PAPYR_8787 [Paratrimastix pyriformis]|uniref:Uncharacterized protein n=1 Tax=Paratrimastix pyriformis TaxID=342808 RepID=A0ABQ8UBD8_9EUKA|nr:hypothetical protein PAPYR_8787 [Paratrimastix pyriformis]
MWYANDPGLHQGRLAWERAKKMELQSRTERQRELAREVRAIRVSALTPWQWFIDGLQEAVLRPEAGRVEALWEKWVQEEGRQPDTQAPPKASEHPAAQPRGTTTDRGKESHPEAAGAPTRGSCVGQAGREKQTVGAPQPSGRVGHQSVEGKDASVGEAAPTSPEKTHAGVANPGRWCAVTAAVHLITTMCDSDQRLAQALRVQPETRPLAEYVAALQKERGKATLEKRQVKSLDIPAALRAQVEPQLYDDKGCLRGGSGREVAEFLLRPVKELLAAELQLDQTCACRKVTLKKESPELGLTLSSAQLDKWLASDRLKCSCGRVHHAQRRILGDWIVVTPAEGWTPPSMIRAGDIYRLAAGLVHTPPADGGTLAHETAFTVGSGRRDAVEYSDGAPARRLPSWRSLPEGKTIEWVVYRRANPLEEPQPGPQRRTDQAGTPDGAAGQGNPGSPRVRGETRTTRACGSPPYGQPRRPKRQPARRWDDGLALHRWSMVGPDTACLTFVTRAEAERFMAAPLVGLRRVWGQDPSWQGDSPLRSGGHTGMGPRPAGPMTPRAMRGPAMAETLSTPQRPV